MTRRSPAPSTTKPRPLPAVMTPAISISLIMVFCFSPRLSPRPVCRSGLGEGGYPSPGHLSHPTDVPVDTDGDIYVTDWGNHRVCVFDLEGKPIAQLIGDAHVLSKWGQQTVSANPDMEKARRRVKSLEPQWRFCFPAAGGVRSGNRQRHRCRQPTQSPADL